MPDLSLDDAKKDVILFPTRIPFLEHPAKTAEVLELARHVGLPQIYILIQGIPQGKKVEVMWKLRDSCARLNVRYIVVSSKKSQILLCVSLFNLTSRLERDLLEGG